MRHAVITGGMGFIGHHLWMQLIRMGWRVDVIDNLRFVKTRQKMRERHRSLMLEPWHHASADNFELMEKIVDTADTVLFHLASHPNQKAVAEDPLNACDNIVGLTSRLADYCKVERLRMVYVSSSMVYGNWVAPKAVEDQPLSPTNLYGLYKKQAEEIVRMTIPHNHVIIRPSAVYGAHDSEDRVITRWMRAAAKGEPIKVDDPDALLDFTYVKDLAKGIAMAGARRNTGTYNMTGGDPQTLMEAATAINDMFNNRSEIVAGKGLPSDQPRRGALDNDRARMELNWHPNISFLEGIYQTRMVIDDDQIL